ncbi:hypothetical protein [Streptomyces sp. NPDC053048]|uniref:hypothetical protein n=1 Tax=Streptomyces sp. NPDC053048 TaxID=3365694 RepID=UPI0037D3A60F
MQVPYDIIRHPRLSSNAIHLLLYSLSLPSDVDISLSEAARRAGIKKAAFMRAKRELIAEGYFHEWREQGPGGRWRTTQLVSNTPLTPEEATSVRPGGSPPAPPTAPEPVVGEPEGPAVGHQTPEDNQGENTTHPPLQPVGDDPLAERGAQALVAVTRGDRRLRLSSRDVAQLAPLAAEWLRRGVSLGQMREDLTAGLPAQVRSAKGILRDRLLRKMPDPAAPASVPPVAPPQPLQACSGGCGRLFRPLAEETACRECRCEQAAGAPPGDDTSGAVAATRRGMAMVREALSLGASSA